MMAQMEPLIAGRYRMGPLLGSGGFGAVYLATDERLHRSVAIKICSTRRLPPDEAAEAARLFQSEALTLARLRHPGLTAIWDYFNQDNDWYLVMEYVPGETLRDLMRRVAGPLPQAEALNYAQQICSVLTYLHKQHPPVVFRDLKPANVMVTPEGQLKLIDFGIARLFSPGKAADTAQFGTPGYAPPEQYGGQTEPRSDIYSLGVLLHQMLTGHNPAASPFALPSVRSLNPAIPQAVEALVVQATAYEIDDRVPTAEEFCRALDAAMARPMTALTTPVARITPKTSIQPVTGPTTSRQLWSPSPRQLPNRPVSGGAGRGLVLILLLAILLGSLGAGAYLLQSQIALMARDLFVPSAVSAPLGREPSEIIVFSVRSKTAQGNIHEDLYIKRGNKVQPLTDLTDEFNAALPAISPDGRRIAFTRSPIDNSRKQQVWLVDADGRNLRPLLPDNRFSRAPEWSPDSRRIVLETAEPGKEMQQQDLMIVDVETGQARPLVTRRFWDGGPTWSPDGAHIVFHGTSASTECMQLFVVNVATGAIEQLTDLSSQMCRAETEGDFWPNWSPDGTWIAFGRKLRSRDEAESPDAPIKKQIALLDTTTKEVTILRTGSTPAEHPRWSASGKHLLFEQEHDDLVSLVRYDLEAETMSAIDTSHSDSHLADWR
jgi:serine/threonine protein kinase